MGHGEMTPMLVAYKYNTVEMAMEMEMEMEKEKEKEKVPSYLVGPKKRWRTGCLHCGSNIALVLHQR